MSRIVAGLVKNVTKQINANALIAMLVVTAAFLGLRRRQDNVFGGMASVAAAA